MRHLRIYTASDDLVEFEGIVNEEFNIYEAAEFEVTAVSPDGERSFCIGAEFTDGWRLSFDFYTGGDIDDEDRCDPRICNFNGIVVAHTGKNNDPVFLIPFEDDETVTVVRLDEDADDETW
jgi:hypothetical protein